MSKISIVLLSFIILFISCREEQSQQNELEAKEIAIKATINDMVTQCWNNKDMEKFREIATENFIRKNNGIIVANNRNEMEATMNIFFTGFPDLEVILNNTIIKGNQAFTQWTALGTNTGIFGETAATGKKVKFIGYSVGYYNDKGKYTGEEVYYNELELLQQLGYSLVSPIVE
jgi:predicted ester cyclase